MGRTIMDDFTIEEVEGYIMDTATLNDSEYLEHDLSEEGLMIMIVDEDQEERFLLVHYNLLTDVCFVAKEAYTYLSKRAVSEVERILKEN